MKKVFIAILAFLYMFVSSGVAMEIHYCMGKKAGMDLYGTGNDKCGKCGMKEKKGCCSDEHKFFKLNDSHKNVSNNINFETPVIAIVTTHPIYDFKLTANADTGKVLNNSPPEYSGPSACILNCVFRL